MLIAFSVVTLVFVAFCAWACKQAGEDDQCILWPDEEEGGDDGE